MLTPITTLFISLVGSVLTAALDGWAGVCFWRWFLMPVLKVDIPAAFFVGCSLMISLVIPMRDVDCEEDPVATVTRANFYAIFKPSFLLLCGCIVHHFAK